MLVEPDYTLWKARHVQQNACAFSSPGWLELWARCGRGRIRWLTSPSLRGAGLNIPCMVMAEAGDGCEVMATPDWFYAMPVGAGGASAGLIRDVYDAAAALEVGAVHWALPPWCDVPAGAWLDGMPAGVLTRSMTYMIRVDGDADSVLAQKLNATMRNEARRNHRRGVVVRRAADEAEERSHFELYQRIRAELGWHDWARPWVFHRDFESVIGAGGELVVVAYEERLVGGGILLYDDHAVEVYYMYRDPAERGVFPTVALMDYAIREAARRGLPWVNLGGVGRGRDGLRQFKRAWGAEPHEYWQMTVRGAERPDGRLRGGNALTRAWGRIRGGAQRVASAVS